MGWMVGDGGVKQIALTDIYILHMVKIRLVYCTLRTLYSIFIMCCIRMPIHYVIHYNIICCNATTIVVAAM